MMSRPTERKIIATALAMMTVSSLFGLVLMFSPASYEPQWLVAIALSGLPIAALTATFSLIRA